MKRFATAAVAATTALSLAVVPAEAAPSDNDDFRGYGHASSSQVTEDELNGYLLTAALVELAKPGAGISAPYFGSSKAGMFEAEKAKDGENQTPILKSSAKNDANNGYKLGTTYDILVGTGIAVAVLALLGGVAVQQGLIKLPF